MHPTVCHILIRSIVFNAGRNRNANRAPLRRIQTCGLLSKCFVTFPLTKGNSYLNGTNQLYNNGTYDEPSNNRFKSYRAFLPKCGRRIIMCRWSFDAFVRNTSSGVAFQPLLQSCYWWCRIVTWSNSLTRLSILIASFIFPCEHCRVVATVSFWRSTITIHYCQNVPQVLC